MGFSESYQPHCRHRSPLQDQVQEHRIGVPAKRWPFGRVDRKEAECAAPRISCVSDGGHAASGNSSADVEDNSLKPATSRLLLQAYVLLMLIIPALFLASSIPIVRSQSFPLESGDPFLLNSDYAFSLKHVDCEVVIYGDSTALTGLDPTVF